MTDEQAADEHVRKALVGLSLALKSAMMQAESLVGLYSVTQEPEEPKKRPLTFGDDEK